MKLPGIIISALRGGSGKTVLSIGLIAAWKQAGKKVVPFKKGPDYIDAGWLALAAGRPCYNLDTFLIDPQKIIHTFVRRANSCEVSVIEGNRGLYDGIDTEGATSTAELSKLLGIPVILCIDCTKSTRTIAALVSGIIHFDSRVNLAGVILNRVAGSRHENVIRTNIERYCGIPVVGTLPKLSEQHFPERHMGLVPTPEHDWAQPSIASAAETARKYLDLKAIEEISSSVANGYLFEEIEHIFEGVEKNRKKPHSGAPIIGILRDSAFQFYYPENLEALESEGARLLFFSPLSEEPFPEDIDAVYIGGGFPETHAEQLAKNIVYRTRLKELSILGMPIYAECGGLMYLGEDLVMDGKTFPMTGILPISFGLSKRPKGHGYTIIEVEGDNPFFPPGTEIRGHEFHYSSALSFRGSEKDLTFRMKRGTGLLNHRDGIRVGNVLATYTHIHAEGTPDWAKAFVRNAIEFRQKKSVGR